MSRRLSVGIAILVIGMATAFAAPLHYSEAQGDLSNQHIGSLDVGLNTVSGRFCFDNVPIFPACLTGGEDFDSFRFTVPDGLALEDITFSFSTVSSFAIFLGTRYFLGGVGSSGELDVTTSGSLSLFDWALPVGAGEYLMSHSAVLLIGALAKAEVQYTWSLEVARAQVPIPGTLGLLIVALAGLSLGRRRA